MAKKLIQPKLLSVNDLPNWHKREMFMQLYRSDDLHAFLTPDDCVEIFTGILVGSSDLTLKLFETVMRNYNVGWEEVIADIPTFIRKLKGLFKFKIKS